MNKIIVLPIKTDKNAKLHKFSVLAWLPTVQNVGSTKILLMQDWVFRLDNW